MARLNDDQKKELSELAHDLASFNGERAGVWISIHQLESYVDGNYNLCGGGDKDDFSYTGVSQTIEQICHYFQLKKISQSSELINRLDSIHYNIYGHHIKLTLNDRLKTYWAKHRYNIVDRTILGIDHIKRAKRFLRAGDSIIFNVIVSLMIVIILALISKHYIWGLKWCELNPVQRINLLESSVVMFFGLAASGKITKEYTLALALCEIVLWVVHGLMFLIEYLFCY